MAVVYILYSKKGDHYYIGSCKDFNIRFNEHIEKVHPKSFTSRFDDLETFLTINDLEYEQARNIEKHIKRMKSKTYILNLKKYDEIVKRLIEKYKA